MALNSKLKSVGKSLNICCVGGYVLELYNLKTTQDVDAFYKSDTFIDCLIKEVGDEYCVNCSYNENWLNNSVANIAPQTEPQECTLLYSFSNLNVYIASLEYVLCMKLCTYREKDMDDVVKILRLLDHINSPLKVFNLLDQYGFAIKHYDKSRVIEAFHSAYGDEWLEQYYLEHEQELFDMVHLWQQ